MAEKTGLIPLRKKVKELEQVYHRTQREIGMTLLSVDPANFRELNAIKAQKRIEGLIRNLNRMSIRWAKESVPMAYEKGYVVARTSLEILGAKKDKAFNINVHRFAIDDYIEKTMKDLITANQSIKINVNMYLYLARRASAGLMQIQAFGLADDEVISEIIMDTMEMGEARGYASKRIYEYLRLQLLDGKFISKSGRNYNLRDYSKMVARTRLRQAQTDAVKNTCKEYDNDLVQWSRHSMPCPECAEYEGQIYSLTGKSTKYPFIPAEPPLHPNCVLSETRCITPSGLIAGLRARYNGQIIKFTFSNGSQLSVTPYHLLLTSHGFITAQFLRHGDDVFYCPDFERIIAGNPYNNGMPSRIDDIVNSLSESISMTTTSVPVSAKYLHGDGRLCDGNVDIIRPNGFLGDTLESPFFKKAQTSPFNSTNSEAFLFSGERNLTTMLKTLALTADSIMGNRHSSVPFFFAHTRSSNSMTLTNASQRKASSNKSLPNAIPRYSKLFSNINKQSSGLINTIKIVGINIESFHGYVYDLHTHTSLYLANGILSSNCEHDISPTSEVAIEYREAYV